jgi:GTP cyclohydrolase I
MRVASRQNPRGQPTVASISATARIIHDFQAQWIHRFVQILHSHGKSIGTGTLRENIFDYLHELDATMVKISFCYPFFMTKTTPRSEQECIVRYNCTYSAKVTATSESAKILLKVEVPALTTDPASTPNERRGLFAQLSKVQLEVQPHNEVYPEDLVDVVDRHCLAPVYSFLTQADQAAIIRQVHSTRRSSVVMVDAVKEELARNSSVEWYSVACENLSMLNCYGTIVGTEKDIWIPSTCYDFSEL